MVKARLEAFGDASVDSTICDNFEDVPEDLFVLAASDVGFVFPTTFSEERKKTILQDILIEYSITRIVLAAFKDMIDTAMFVASRMFPFMRKTLYVPGIMDNVFQPTSVMSTASVVRGLASLRAPALFAAPFSNPKKAS